MVALIKAHWLIILIVLAVIVAIFYFSGGSSAAYKMLIDTLRTDQSKVVQVLEQQLSSSEKDVAALEAAKAQLQKDKATLQKKADESSAKVTQLNGEIDALQKKYAAYSAPTDPNAIIDDLHKLGIGSIRIR
jgi:peptidoglycan hydrolase CwlO-like protein